MTTIRNFPQKKLDELKISPEVGYYLKTRGYELPKYAPKLKTPEPRDVPGAMFDFARVDHVVNVFSKLQHTQGEWAGQPLTLRSWQIAYLIAPTYGWVKKNKRGNFRRIVRKQYLDIPRKNAKTTVGGGQAIYLTAADKEAGAQVFAVATTKDQAKYCFDPIRTLAINSPYLRKNIHATKDKLEHLATGSSFRAVASAADALHGSSPHGAFIDELHLHTSHKLIEAIETGVGARTQSLIMYATTADEGGKNSPYERIRGYAEQLADGALVDPSFYGVVFGADETAEGFDPFSVEAQMQANPGFAAGDSPTQEFLEQAAAMAKNSPADLSSYLRLHLGIRTKQTTKYLTMESWDRNEVEMDEASLEGRTAFGGLDLASTSDLTALCWLFENEAGGYDAIWRLWTPEENVKALDKRTAGNASVWVRQGLLRTNPGNILDYEMVVRDIKADAERFNIAGIAYDPWNANDVTTKLANDDILMVKTTQTMANLSSPLKEVQRLLLGGTEEEPLLRHGKNAAVRWQVDNLSVHMDASGNVRPDKDKSHEKIDAVAALVDAMALAINLDVDDEPSIYETRAPLVF